tara:strand:+ start:1414 stop:1608 length:195 start_codon:yes stop_codon:yes gene_type:complete
MPNKKSNISSSIDEVEIINRRTHKKRIININKKEIIIYNDELNQFQLLPAISASYDGDSESKNG